MNPDSGIKCLEEIKLSSKMDNEHIVKCYGACFSDKEDLCLIMELVHGGDLSTRIHNKNQHHLEYIEVLQVHTNEF